MKKELADAVILALNDASFIPILGDMLEEEGLCEWAEKAHKEVLDPQLLTEARKAVGLRWDFPPSVITIGRYIHSANDIWCARQEPGQGGPYLTRDGSWDESSSHLVSFRSEAEIIDLLTKMYGGIEAPIQYFGDYVQERKNIL